MEDVRLSELQKYPLVEPNENSQISEQDEARLQNCPHDVPEGAVHTLPPSRKKSWLV